MADESIEQRQDKYNFKDGVTVFFRWNWKSVFSLSWEITSVVSMLNGLIFTAWSPVLAKLQKENASRLGSWDLQ